jgi:hypothetical protein
LKKFLLVALVLSLTCADASAGPIRRLIERRKGSCASGSCGAATGAVRGYAVAPVQKSFGGFVVVKNLTGGCPGGKCPKK